MDRLARAARPARRGGIAAAVALVACLGPGADVAPAAPVPAGIVRDSSVIASLSGAEVPAPGGPAAFTVRRMPNPRYQPPAPAGRVTPLGLPVPHAMDDLHTAVIHRREGSMPLTEWQLGMREDQGSSGTWEIAGSGRNRPGRTELLDGHLSASRRTFFATAGDLPAPTLRVSGPLMRLRGASFGRAYEDGRGWVALAAAAAPGTGSRPVGTALSLFAIEGVRLGSARAAFTASAFERSRAPSAGAASFSRTEFPGRGGAGAVEIRSAPGRDLVALALGAQLHDLGGHDVPAVTQRFECRLLRPSAAFTLIEQRASRAARSLANERLARAASRDDRLSAQWRAPGGRAETHLAAVASSGEGALPSSRGATLGASSGFGRSAWYAGAESEWRGGADTAPLTTRVTARLGRLGPAGSSLLLQLERVRERGALPVFVLSGQAASRSGGLQASLEPRVGWRDGTCQRYDLDLRVSWGRAGSLTRLTASLTLGGTRENAFLCRTQEAALRLSFAPRLRDRGTFEIKRAMGTGSPSWELESDYDLQSRRELATPGLALARGWTGTVHVIVARSEDGTAVPDALVSLDGRRLAFTSADGTAVFEQVEPGIHVLSIDERSLPRGWRAASTTQIFVAIERGKPVEPVRIEVARAARRTEF